METLRKIRVNGFWWTFFSGHFSIGRITFFGENAMHWSMVIHDTKWGHIHIDLPTFSRLIGRKSWCCFASPNATPWACTWYIGTSNSNEKIRARIRKLNFGHNFNSEKEYQRLRCLNEKFEWFSITDFDMQKFGYPK